jgi:hypothetical protein
MLQEIGAGLEGREHIYRCKLNPPSPTTEGSAGLKIVRIGAGGRWGEQDR